MDSPEPRRARLEAAGSQERLDQLSRRFRAVSQASDRNNVLRRVWRSGVFFAAWCLGLFVFALIVMAVMGI